MKLEVGERLALLGILPEEGDFTTMKIIRDLKNTLSFTEEEHKAYKFRVEENNIFWENNGRTPKDISIGEVATTTIVMALKKLNEEKKIKNEHLNLYEKFVGG